MPLTDVSQALLDGMTEALDQWAELGGERESLYWVLRAKAAEANGSPAGSVGTVAGVPAELRNEVERHLSRMARYWDNIRYAGLDRVTQLWGTVVNAVRVAAGSDAVTPKQREVFDFDKSSIVAFLRSARARMRVADQLYHAFKPMPAPECQALAALLNVHIDAQLDESSMCRLVRLLDAEGPLSDEESADLASLTNTALVDAAFRGLRGQA